MNPRTVQDVIANLSNRMPSAAFGGEVDCSLPAPPYTGTSGSKKMLLGVESLCRHMTSENWQTQMGLEEAGYRLCGHNLTIPYTNVQFLINELNPDVVMVYDKREWDGLTLSSRHDKEAKFYNTDSLRYRNSIFKATILKDAQHLQMYLCNFAEEIGCHAWAIFYHPDIVHHLAPYTRKQHLVRTYHCIDRNEVPDFLPAEKRRGCLLSGAISGKHYPLRYSLYSNRLNLPDCHFLKHPGYNANGPQSEYYLRLLNTYKVAICTSSIYGYALRKIMEATAVGCRVLTDLPIDDVLPEIDDNLYRIHPQDSFEYIADTLRRLIYTYDEKRQRNFAKKAMDWYDYRVVGQRLAANLEKVRLNYSQRSSYSGAANL